MTKPQGPKPISVNGRLPGKGFGKAAMSNPFSRWLKYKRVRSNFRGEPLSQAKLAELLGMPLRRIQKLEQGDQMLRLEWVEDFAEFFREDADKLYLMTYNLPPDMHLFLTTTEQGERAVKNIRNIMNIMKQKGVEPTRRPEMQNYPTEVNKDYWTLMHYSRLDDEVQQREFEALQTRREESADE